MDWYDWTAFVLVTLAAVNWGLLLFDVNLVAMLFQSWAPMMIKVIYGAMGVAGLTNIWFRFN